jgi:thioredoxin 1
MAKEWTVFVLCAEWCGVCRALQPACQSFVQSNPEVGLYWIDIEDEADRLGSLEVETFPTIAIARGADPVFFGPMKPDMRQIESLMNASQDKTWCSEEGGQWVHTLMKAFTRSDDEKR